MTITFGKVPHPIYEDRPITKAEGMGQNNLGKRSVKGVVWHRMIGSLRGTDTYFHRPDTKALTDYGVGVAAQDGAADDGVIIRWNDPLGSQSGWASGSYSSAAYGDGAAFTEKYGINAINRDQASIEISGLTYDVPLSEKSRNAIAQLTAYWADQYGIPWDVFPIAPQDGFSFVRWHNEFGPDNGAKRCPGSVVMQETSALIERTRQIMKAYQVTAAAEDPAPTPKPPSYAVSVLPEWWDRALEQRTPSDAMVDGVRWFAIRRRVEAIRNANRYSRPDTSAPKSGPKVLVREKVNVERWFRDNDGRQWIVEDAGHYVPANAFTPAISIRGR
jgi:hypothetical protein